MDELEGVGEGPEGVDELDDDMRSLLEQLDQRDECVADQMQGIVGAPSPEPTLTSTAGEAQPNYRQTPPAELLQPQDVRKLGLLVESNAEVPEPEPAIVDLREQFKQFDIVTDEILQGARSDRQETQDAINLMRGEIDKAINGGAHPSRMYVDNLVKALEVKATINQTAVKIMEAKAKMLAATKVGISVNTNIQTNVATGSSDQGLVDLLSKNPLHDSEDEY
jgi:hypothetical protein